MDSGKLAFLGLGVMGFPMAGHLARAGHSVTVYNRTPAKAAQWVEKYGGSSAPTPAAAAADAALVMMCVGNDDDVRAVALGADGAVAAMRAGSVLVDHTTASATVAREVHAAAKARGVGFLDAPVSGGQAGAENGKLTIMVGGDADVFAARRRRARALRARGDPDGRPGVGPADQDGQPDLHRRAGPGAVGRHQLRPARPGSTPSACSTSSAKARRNPGRWTIAARRWPPTSSTSALPSTGCARTSPSARPKRGRNGAALPVTALVDQFYARIQARGGGRWDTSSLIRLLRD